MAQIIEFPSPTDVVPVTVEYASVVPGSARLCAAFSATRRLTLAYRGPVTRLRRESDGAESDFYADHKSDTVTTARHGRGHRLAGWRSNSAVRVTTWYDQSGGAAHAVQTIPALQPYIDTSSGMLTSVTTGEHLVVPARATSAFLGGLESTAVMRARAPTAEVSLHNYDDDDPSAPPWLLLSASASVWKMWGGELAFGPALFGGFETLSVMRELDTDAPALSAYREARGSDPVAAKSILESASSLPPVVSSNATLRLQGDLEHVYLFDASSHSFSVADTEFGLELLPLTPAFEFITSNAYLSSETLVIKGNPTSNLTLTHLSSDLDAARDRIRHVAAEHMWQTYGPDHFVLNDEEAALEEHRFTTSVVLKGDRGDMYVFGEAHLSNDVFAAARMCIGGDLIVAGGNVTLSNADLYLGGDAAFDASVRVGGVDVAAADAAGVASVFSSRATFLNAVCLSNSATFKGNASFHAPIDIQGDVTVGGRLSFSADAREAGLGGAAADLSRRHVVRSDHAPDGDASDSMSFILGDGESSCNLGFRVSGVGVHAPSGQTLGGTHLHMLSSSTLRSAHLGADTVGGVSLETGRAVAGHGSGVLAGCVSNAADAGVALRIGSAHGGARVDGDGDSDVSLSLHASASSHMRIGCGFEFGRMYIEASGEYGIEFSTPDLPASNALLTTPASTSFVVRAGGADLSSGACNGLTVHALSNHVGVGLALGAVPVAPLHVEGEAYFSGDVHVLSDARAKTGLEVIGDALGRVGALHGYTYLYKGSSVRTTGLIAQEVLRVLPEAVHTDGASGTLSLAYGNLAGLFVEAIKELGIEVSRLRLELATRTSI
jgi:hypothetical protein